MPSRPVGVADTAPSTTVVEVDVLERASPDLTTTLTADPGTGGTVLAVTSAAKFPATNNYKVRVEDEVMLVTGGAGTLSWTVTRAQDSTTAVAHAITTPVAEVVGLQRVAVVSERQAQVSYKGIATSFRTPGRATTTQNLFSIFNASGSKVLVAVRRISVQMDATAVLTAVAPSVKVARSTVLPTNGTALTGNKLPFDSALTSSASVTLAGDASADGTSSASTLTSTPGTSGWSQMVMRLHTAVGQVIMDDASVIPTLCQDEPIILRASQGLLVHLAAAATTSNPVTNHYIVNCMWEEFTVA